MSAGKDGKVMIGRTAIGATALALAAMPANAKSGQVASLLTKAGPVGLQTLAAGLVHP